MTQRVGSYNAFGALICTVQKGFPSEAQMNVFLALEASSPVVFFVFCFCFFKTRYPSQMVAQNSKFTTGTASLFFFF